METNQHFVDSLLAIKYHYQALVEEYEHQLVQAREQLTHVNALLVENTQLSQIQLKSEQFVDSLIGLRNHYQALCEEQRRKVTQAREQLSHINALLVDQLVLPHNNHQTVSMQALTVNQDQALALKEGSVLKNETPVKKLDESTADYPKENLDSQSPQTSSQSQLEPNQPSTTPVEEGTVEEPRELADAPSQLPVSYLNTKTELLPKYENFNKLQAVESLLSENAGTILHIDFVIRTLYGDLEAEAFAQEKVRMHDTLRKGTSKGLWDKVPDQSGCYTIDLSLLEPKTEPSPTATTKQSTKINRHQIKPARGKSLKMIPPYQNLSLIEAVETIVRSHPGKSLTIAFVVQELYGDLSGKPMSEAKERVGEALWRGTKQKRWQRLPEQLGRYTLDLQLMSSEAATASL